MTGYGTSGRLALPGVSRETLDRLRGFEDLVQKWTPRINLVSANSLPDLWNRHIVDSAQLYALAPEKAGQWLDLGSGGGFPGLVVAILADADHRRIDFTLVESDQRKAAFLRAAARETGVSVTVRTDRIEALAPQQAGVLSARALAPLNLLLQYAARHLGPRAWALFPKGKNAEAEIAKARSDWQFDLRQIPSITTDDGQILVVENIARVRS
jgi:16S rRNA (guanine527-N7)-methyltransferase